MQLKCCTGISNNCGSNDYPFFGVKQVPKVCNKGYAKWNVGESLGGE
jgi:hypothetical protein